MVVGPASPAISTTPSAGGTVGVTLNDSANLTGGFNPMGKITFNLYGPGDTSCTGSVLFTQDVSVSGTGTYNTTGGYATVLAGTYHWTASYVSSDVNNTSVASACADEPVVVGPASPAISTTPSAGGTVGVTLNDSANLTGGFNPMGKITFNLYGPGDTQRHQLRFRGDRHRDGERDQCQRQLFDADG
ncbi:MAG: hypothetical protein E6I58_00965 [Chloroflexi bacterium]|nr:MAG: hypothetical protein E6I58_00965 [Chloroflexota bacterium]